jgi:23S rRNA (cytidine1920-2'-O)/16S rRNA (cytidine1409-2'-O)-methyltransferase
MMRLDLYLFENGLAHSRTFAKALIGEGKVSVGEKIITKPSFDVAENDSVSVTDDERYVSRGAYKLEGAIKAFGINVKSRLCIDIGASSGGFTDYLLKHGADKVIAVDSGYGQLAESLRTDSRVITYENYNARYMKREDFEFTPSLAVMDVSFISATYIIPRVYDVLSSNGEFVCLIKPQFEVGRNLVGKGGIVKDDKARASAIEKVVSCAESVGFKCIKTIKSPITGGDGNIEYLAHFVKV